MSVETSAESEFTIRSEFGLHARPAARFAQLAGDFEAEISMGRPGDGEWVNGCSVLSILSLAAGAGTTLLIRAVGTDAAEAVRRLGELLEEEDAR